MKVIKMAVFVASLGFQSIHSMFRFGPLNSTEKSNFVFIWNCIKYSYNWYFNPKYVLNQLIKQKEEEARIQADSLNKQILKGMHNIREQQTLSIQSICEQIRRGTTEMEKIWQTCDATTTYVNRHCGNIKINVNALHKRMVTKRNESKIHNTSMTRKIKATQRRIDKLSKYVRELKNAFLQQQAEFDTITKAQIEFEQAEVIKLQEILKLLAMTEVAPPTPKPLPNQPVLYTGRTLVIPLSVTSNRELIHAQI